MVTLNLYVINASLVAIWVMDMTQITMSVKIGEMWQRDVLVNVNYRLVLMHQQFDFILNTT